jgi:hypothetical protein
MLGQMLLPQPKTRSPRLTQGVILLVGAIVIVVAISASPTGFHRPPPTVGLTHLAAEVPGGWQGSYWATVLTGAVGLVNLARAGDDVRGAPGTPVAR